MSRESTKIFVCFEPDVAACAERLDAWTHTNHDRSLYNRRMDVAVDSAEAEPFKRVLREQIQDAEVMVCIVSQTASLNEWIAWELETARSALKGLVGVKLSEHNPHPPAMVDRGAIFVSFKEDLVERAIEWAMTERHTSDDFMLEDD